MEALNEIKNLIAQAKNICIIPNQDNEPESIANALALFYTLKELRKNVNLIIDRFPEKLSFLVPSIDYISSPKNVVISVPRDQADVSQIYYERDQSHLKIHLTLDKGQLKKDHISFYYSDPKPDLVITLGIHDIQKELLGKLDSFGFILDTPIANLDDRPENTRFGTINLIQPFSLSESTQELIQYVESWTPKAANCLLAGLITHYDNFTSKATSPDTFQRCADLVKMGADHAWVTNELYALSGQEMHFLGAILQNLKQESAHSPYIALLDTTDFQHFNHEQIASTVQALKTIRAHNDVLALWKSHASDPMIKGFLFSKNPATLTKLAAIQGTLMQQGWTFIAVPGADLLGTKTAIIETLTGSLLPSNHVLSS